MALDARQIAWLLRLDEPHLVAEGKGWELWSYRVRDPASQVLLSDAFHFLFVKSRGLGWGDLPILAADVGPRGRLSVVVQRSSRLARDMPRLLGALRASTGHVVADLLGKEGRYQLGEARSEQAEFPHFVEPYIGGRPALKVLADWLLGQEAERDEEERIPSVAALLAPAGLGKTSVVRELTRELANRGKNIVPLLIESSQWSEMSPQERPSLWTLIQNALRWRGHNPISPEAFEVLARGGCIVPIFDGLDELGALRSGQVSPVSIMTQLFELSGDSDCRVLVTSRDSLWTEIIPEEQRSAVHEFQLQPFRREQVGKYREKRFPNPRDPARTRFDELVDRVTARAHASGEAGAMPEERIRATPLVLHLLASVAEDSDNARVSGVHAVMDWDAASAFSLDPLFGVTVGITHREASRRQLRLSAKQQFHMMFLLATDLGRPPFSAADLHLAAETALGVGLAESDKVALAAYPLLKKGADGTFSWRFEYLASFTPAAWLAAGLVEGRADRECQNGIRNYSHRASASSGHMIELLSHCQWRDIVVRALPGLDAETRSSLWSLAQSLLFREDVRDRLGRTRELARIFGVADGARVEFRNIIVAGEVANLDLTQTTFRHCVMRDSVWIQCAMDNTTAFQDCEFRGSLAFVSSPGVGSALFEGLSPNRVDPQAQAVLDGLVSSKVRLTVSDVMIREMIVGVLNAFYSGTYLVPRHRMEVSARTPGFAPLRESVIDALLESHILQVDVEGLLRVVRKFSSSLTALLDNGTLSGPLVRVEQTVRKAHRAV